jgi:hypothetical protein
MKVSTTELGIVALVIGYIAFYTHPVPYHIKDFLSSPVGTLIALLAILGITVYKSLIIGVFLAIAFIMSVGNLTEYLDPADQTPTNTQPSNKAPAPENNGALMKMLGKSIEKAGKKEEHKLDRISQHHQKKGTQPPPKPQSTSPPKPNTPNMKVMETFASV